MSEPEVLPPSLPLDNADKKRELDLREREIAAREREVTAKESEINRSPWLNPLVIGLFAAAIGLAGNSVVALLNNRNSQAVEHFRAQSSLIIGAISGGGTGADIQKSCNNLLFLVNLRLVDDTNTAIKQACIIQPQRAPALGPSLGWCNVSSGPIPPIVKGGAPIGMKYQSIYTKDQLKCVNETVKVSATEWQ
jgi:hypothetical protein